MIKAMRLAALAAAYAFVCYVIVVAPAYAFQIASSARQAPAETARPLQCRTVTEFVKEHQIIATTDGRTLPLVVLRPVYKRVCW